MKREPPKHLPMKRRLPRPSPPRTAPPVPWLAPRALDPEVRAEVERIRLVDTHEHLDEEAVRLSQPNDLKRFFMYYTFDDMVSAGLPGEAQGRFFKTDDGMEQWKLIRDFWPLARNTGYCQAVLLSIRELYGIDDLRDDTIEPLLREVAARNRPGVTRWILRTKCNIECCIVNAEDPGDLARRTALPGLFVFDVGAGKFLVHDLDLAPYEKFTGLSCGSLRDWKRMVDWYFARWGKQAAGVKSAAAYWRTMRFDDVSEADAAPLFERWAVRRENVTPAERRAAQDHMFHYIVQRAVDYDLPVHLHAGYHAGTNYSDMSIFQVKDLANMFRLYPKARFVIMHLGYPEWTDLVYLAKHYSNVYVDFCWAWTIDPFAALACARQCLAAVPSDKVLGYGGDYGYADMVYGHQRMARDGMALVLSEAVRDGRLKRADARKMARRWLRENALEIFRLDQRRATQALGQPGPHPEGK